MAGPSAKPMALVPESGVAGVSGYLIGEADGFWFPQSVGLILVAGKNETPAIDLQTSLPGGFVSFDIFHNVKESFYVPEVAVGCQLFSYATALRRGHGGYVP